MGTAKKKKKTKNQEWNPYFPQSSRSPKSKPRLPSKPNILGIHLPSEGALYWGAWCGPRMPCFLEGTCAIVIILLHVGHKPGGMSLDLSASLTILPAHCDSFFITLLVDLLW